LDPLFDYYLCTKDGETELMATFLDGGEVPVGYDNVQKLAYWQALQWVVALDELERSPADGRDLFSLTEFMRLVEEVDPRALRSAPVAR
jgi:hypothetical protein